MAQALLYKTYKLIYIVLIQTLNFHFSGCETKFLSMEEIGSEILCSVSRCGMRISPNEKTCPGQDASGQEFNVEIRQ